MDIDKEKVINSKKLQTEISNNLPIKYIIDSFNNLYTCNKLDSLFFSYEKHKSNINHNFITSGGNHMSSTTHIFQYSDFNMYEANNGKQNQNDILNLLSINMEKISTLTSIPTIAYLANIHSRDVDSTKIVEADILSN